MIISSQRVKDLGLTSTLPHNYLPKLISAPSIFSFYFYFETIFKICDKSLIATFFQIHALLEIVICIYTFGSYMFSNKIVSSDFNGNE